MDKFDVVESWIANVQYSHSKSKLTASRYKRELKAFTNFIGKTPERILEEYDSMTDRQFRRKYAQYLRALIAKMSNDGYAPNTINCRITAIRSFFKYNDLPLGHVPVGKIRVVFHNRDITKEEITHILLHSSPRDKTFFCMMAQSGLRPDTLSKLQYEHIKEEFETGTVPMKIYVPSEIAKGEYGSFFTFVGEETVRYLRLYLKNRPHIKPNDCLFVSHGTDKRISTKSVSKTFNKIVRKLEKREVIEKIRKRQYRKPAEVRLYNLRRFFRKHAGQAGVEYVNFWMGHKTNYRASHIPASDEHYFDKTDVEFHRQLYAEKAMPFLRIETATPTETEQTIEELREQLKQKDVLLQKQDERLQVLEQFQKKTLEKLEEYAAFARELKELLPEDKRKKIIQELRKRSEN